jgi:phosphotransferase system IIB component
LPAFVRPLVAAALVVALAGCELFKDNQEVQVIVNKRTVGKPVGEFFDRYGRATASTEIGNSTSIYNWISDRGMTRPGPEGQDERVCRLRLTVDKTGKISDVQILYDAQGTKSSSRCGEIFAAP